MKKTKIAVLGFFVVVLAIYAFALRQTSSIKGTVMPAEKAVKAVAFPSDDKSGKDSMTVSISNGSFEIQNLKPGDYSVVIEATEPYGNALKTGVTVQSGKTTDLGEIQLQQK